MNSKLIFLLTLIVTITACNDKKKKSVEDNVHPTDTTCIKEIAKAKTDLKNNKLVYCNYVGNIVWQALRAENEMQSLLKQNGIEYKDESSPCVIQDNRNYHCYCDFMQEKINDKFGDKFTDSLLYIADSLWIIKNRDKVFDCGSESSCWDKPAMFPGDSIYDQTNHSGLQKEFDKLVKYPTDFRLKIGKNSMAMLQVYLDIDEKGKAKVTNTQFVWDSSKDEEYYRKFWDYFKSIAIPLIEKTTWTPATIKSIGVKSKNDIFIYLK
jgi:hypothetical protein